MEEGCADSAGSSRSRDASTTMRSSSKKAGSFTAVLGLGDEPCAAVTIRSRARDGTVPKPSCRLPSLIESRLDLRRPRAASGIREIEPRLPQIISWRHPAKVAGSPGGVQLPRGGRATSQNLASSAARAFLEELNSRSQALSRSAPQFAASKSVGERFANHSKARRRMETIALCGAATPHDRCSVPSSSVKLLCRFQSQSVLPHPSFPLIAKRLIDRIAFVPEGKLVGKVAAAQLTGLSGGNQKDRFVPISEIGDEAHGRTVAFRSRTHAVTCA